MITGRYRDVVSDVAGHIAMDTGWRSNVIAARAWPVVAALLRNDGEMRGLLFCAVGEGEAAWDAARPSASATTQRLRAEGERRALAAADFAYLDSRGRRASHPTDRLEVTTRFSGPGRRVLREFGLFGGNATTARDSGYLVNYVIHARVDLQGGQTLTRRIRFTLRPGGGTGTVDWLSLPRHWLENESPKILDGVGESSLRTLASAGIDNIGELAQSTPTELAQRLPITKAIELRAKARLALRTAARLTVLPALAPMQAQTVMEAEASALATEIHLQIDEVESVQEQLALLQLALDARALRRRTLSELRGT